MTAFKVEQEMTAPVRAWLEGQGLTVRHEVPTPWGVCDLVGVSLDTTRVEQRLSMAQRAPIGSLRRVELLHEIPDAGTGQSVGMGDLLSGFHGVANENDVRADLDILVQRRFLVRTTRGRFQKRNGWMPLHERVVAVELKLRRIQDVLRQARLNSSFADESFVALPASIAQRAPDLDRVQGSRVGILAVSQHGCEIVRASRRVRAVAVPSFRDHCVEGFWRRHLRDRRA